MTSPPPADIIFPQFLLMKLTVWCSDLVGLSFEVRSLYAGWSGTQDPPASTSQMLGFQARPPTTSLSLNLLHAVLCYDDHKL